MKKNTKTEKQKTFVDAKEDMCSANSKNTSPQACSESYKLSYADQDFLLRDELRPLRLQLELLKPEIILQEHNIHSTIVIFGSTRILTASAAKAKYDDAIALAASNPNDSQLQKKVIIAKRLMSKSVYYDMAMEFSSQVCASTCKDDMLRLVVVTGGGPGIMEAANRGANAVNSPTVGMNIAMPYEQTPNSYITPELCFQFHYFALRKMHFLLRAKALAVFPGGYGTLDELFDALTLMQTHKIKPMPILLFGKEYWDKIINFEEMAMEGVISEKDLSYFQFVESAQQGCDVISEFYK